MREVTHTSQATLGKIVGVERSTICQYESGRRRPDVSILEAMANYFNVSVDFLIGRDYEVTIPVSQWHKSLQQDYMNASNEMKEYLLYKYGGLKFSNEQSIPNERADAHAYTEDEKKLLALIAEMTDEEAEELSNYIDFIISKRK